MPPGSLSLAAGRAVVYSAPSPGSEGPNEDCAALVPYGEDSGVLVVADGVGGERLGTRASRLAVESLCDALEAGARDAIALRTAILNGIERANAAVTALTSGAATTVAVVQIEGHRVRPYHVGDSVILVVGQRGKIKHQSIAHGPVGYAVEAGMLDEGDALHHEERNVVSNVVGSPDMRIEVGPSISLAPRDTVLLASDGLSDNIYPDEIVERIRKGPIEIAAGRLSRLCSRRMIRPKPGQPSKADDLTFIVFRADPAARRSLPSRRNPT